MAFIPAGFEESEDEFEDYDHFSECNSKNDFNENNSHSIETYINVNNSENNHLMVNQNESKTFSPKPERKAFIQMCDSSSAVGLVLDEIRLAVINGDLDYLRMQCEKQFFMDTILKAGWTALMYASNNGHKDIVHFCLESGADPNYHKDSFTPLMAVCGSCHPNEDNLIACLQYLISFGANVNAIDKNGNSPLIYGAKSGKLRVICHLIDAKADINRANKEGWTALHWAVRGGYGPVIEKLIISNIDINLTTNSSQTAAQIAASKGHEKINEILENVKQRISECKSNGTENRRLSHEESELLKTYVKPIINFETQHKYNPIEKNEELENFLRLSHLSELLPKFEENNINFYDLITNTEEVIQRIGVQELSVKKKILSNIILLHKQEWKKESLRDLALDTTVTCADIMSITANIASHLSRIDETIVFLRHKVKKSPQILSYGNDITTVSKVRDEILHALINSRNLFQQLQSFGKELSSMEDISEPPTEDIMKMSLEEDIVNNNKSKSNRSKSILISIGAIGVLSGFALTYRNADISNISNANILNLIINCIPRPNLPKLSYILLTL